MANSKWNKVAENAVMRLLDGAVRKHGLKDVRHAANKWSMGQRDKLRLTKQRAVLEKQLAEVQRRLTH